MNEIDEYLCKVWNKTNTSTQLVAENFWDMCRMLEEDGFLVADNAAISTMSIGPFKIATTIDIQKENMLNYFLKIIVPVVFLKVNCLTFEQAYDLYLLPVIEILINLVNNCFWVRDLLQWELLIFIKGKNREGIYPTIDEIIKSEEFKGFEKQKIENVIKQLKEFRSILGDGHSLIDEDCLKKGFIP